MKFNPTHRLLVSKIKVVMSIAITPTPVQCLKLKVKLQFKFQYKQQIIKCANLALGENKNHTILVRGMFLGMKSYDFKATEKKWQNKWDSGVLCTTGFYKA